MSWRTPSPYLITPESEDEAHFGKPTLLTEGDLYVLLAALEHEDFGLYCEPLKRKLRKLTGS